MLHELARVLRYPRLRAFYDLSETLVYEYISYLRSSSEIVELNPLVMAPIRDVNDLIVMQTAIIGEADVLCSKDDDFFAIHAAEYLNKMGIAVMDEIALDTTVAVLKSTHACDNRSSPSQWNSGKKPPNCLCCPACISTKTQHGEVIYVGKAKNLRARVRSYFNDDRLADVKTGTLIADARDIEYILVDNNKEALALENNLIKQWKPRFNILLRDDKTFPYIKLTNEKYPRVYVTRRLIKDGSTYFGPYFPGNLAHRLVHFIHRHFKVPSCKVDFTRAHTHPCLEYHIHRCLGPCVAGLDHRRSLCRGGSRCAAVPGRTPQRSGSRFAHAHAAGVRGNAL